MRFGIFEFHPATRELRREGTPARLQAQPAQVLAVLVARAGEVVTRELIRQAVWGSETFVVDFERGLNFCVAQIRGALGDSADSPRFIRTLPKRGYQFIAPVTAPEAPAPQRHILSWRLAAAALLAVAVLLAGWQWWASRSTMRIAVTRFDNETGNPDLDRFADGLTDSVVADLTTAHDGRLAVIGNAAILRVPRARRDLQAIASTLGVRYVVLGQVQGDASHPKSVGAPDSPARTDPYLGDAPRQPQPGRPGRRGIRNGGAHQRRIRLSPGLTHATTSMNAK